MGGNSISSSNRVRPTTTPKERKINKLLAELRELTPSERKASLAALKKAGQADLAESLEALMPHKKKTTTHHGGSRPAERPSSGPSRPK